MALGLGLIEGFFGPSYSWSERAMLCDFMAHEGGGFYLYAPKRDPYLRKQWQDKHPQFEWDSLGNLRALCGQQGLAFGLGLSPFELHHAWNASHRALLEQKLKHLQTIQPDFLGLFFDDMRGSANLAKIQIEIIEFVLQVMDVRVLFCPTYYSHDPILDKVFGLRPNAYLQTLGESLSDRVDIAWTGNKVISKEIQANDLIDVSQVLRRKPFVWDNYFANDGPKQCKFFNLKSLEGRHQEAFACSSGWGINPMNQAESSKLAFALMKRALYDGQTAGEVRAAEMLRLWGHEIAERIERAGACLIDRSLDSLDETQRRELIHLFSPYKNMPFADTVLRWLNHEYSVGPECLTD